MSSALVLPGDIIPLPTEVKSQTFGPGISHFPSRAGPSTSTQSSIPVNIIATKAGLLGSGKGKDKAEQIWVEGSSKRYVPAVKELVLGTIIARHAEGYRVDIGSSQMAQLDALAFEGATKRSKPNLKIGTLVYARVSVASRDMDPEVECFDAATGKAEGFGELKGGLIIGCTLQLCRQLLNPKHPVLSALAVHIPFETAIGLNGRIWLKAPNVNQTIALKRIIEGVDAGEIRPEKGDVEKAVKALL